MRIVARLAAALAAAAVAATAARADTITYTDSVAQATTNFTSSVSIPQFDPSLGTLTGIQFTLGGTVFGTSRFESLDASAATITANLASSITLRRPDNSTLVVILPSITTVSDVSAFDGVIDFGGASGRTFPNQTASASDSLTSPPPLSDLALFTGVGNIVLPVTAAGASSATGAGNIVSQFSTQASANVTVAYTFTPRAVPEPSSMALAGLGGLTALGYGLRRRGTKASS